MLYEEESVLNIFESPQGYTQRVNYMSTELLFAFQKTPPGTFKETWAVNFINILTYFSQHYYYSITTTSM